MRKICREVSENFKKSPQESQGNDGNLLAQPSAILQVWLATSLRTIYKMKQIKSIQMD